MDKEVYIMLCVFAPHTVAEPLYGLGYPRRRYVAQNFNCSDFAYGLRNCEYSRYVDPECYNGSHVAGVRCTESKSSVYFPISEVLF